MRGVFCEQSKSARAPGIAHEHGERGARGYNEGTSGRGSKTVPIYWVVASLCNPAANTQIQTASGSTTHTPRGSLAGVGREGVAGTIRVRGKGVRRVVWAPARKVVR